MDIREAITRVRTEVCEFIYDCTECISDGCPYYVLLNTAYNVVNSEQTDAEIPKNALRSDCTGCRFVGTYDTEFPCANCVRKNKDYYSAEQTERSDE